MPTKSSDANKIEVLPSYKPDGTLVSSSEEMCIVLHGYGRVASTEIHYIDDYKFIGGVGYNIPRAVANCWKKGIRPDGKPAISRVFPQAILPADATSVDFAAVTGIDPMPASELAAMINATDAQSLVNALGAQKTAQLIDELKKNLDTIA
jgi:hypothetical protein